MPNPFDANSYGEPSFEDLMAGTLTESAARAKMEADQRAMAEQLRRQESVHPDYPNLPDPMWPRLGAKRTTQSPPRGTAGNPLIQNRASREEDLRRFGYVGGPIDPTVFAGMTEPQAAKAIAGSYLSGAHDRVADDLAASVHAGLNQGKPPLLAEPPPQRALVRRPSVQPMEPERAPDSLVNPGHPEAHIPVIGNVYDERVMERRSQGLPGWQESDFRGLSHEDAMALIADQLKARRVKQLGMFSPDYIQSLPVY